jgi:carboxylesterase
MNQMKDKIAFVLIHGFGGSVSEVYPLAEHLREMGFVSTCSKLNGHTENRKDMAGFSYKDWISSAEKDYLELIKDFESVVIVGFSTGGLIGINLSIKYNIKALVTISTPVYVWNFKHMLLNIINSDKETRIRNLKHYIYSATSFPISSLIQFQILLHKTKAILPKVFSPILILQGLDDDTVRSKSATYIYEKVSSSLKRIHFFEKAGHVVLKGPASASAIQIIQDFLDKEII